jgi:hypothetical protein
MPDPAQVLELPLPTPLAVVVVVLPDPVDLGVAADLISLN